MKEVVVLGAAGFIGKNLCEALGRSTDVSLTALDVQSSPELMTAAWAKSDAIIHLAGVNRPTQQQDFERVNVGVTAWLVESLERAGQTPLIAFSSSSQAAFDNPYGSSKRRAEEVLASWARRSGAIVHLFRFPGVFGKWCRPNYNSVVATFCHNIARNIEISISDPSREIELVYIDDVVAALLRVIEQQQKPGHVAEAVVSPTYRVTLGNLAATIRRFRDSRTSLQLPDLADRFTRCLYATYISYLQPEDFAYSPDQRRDARGALAELLKSPHFGQLFVSRTRPGVTRGNHYHNTKVEKFCVVQGEAVIRLRHLNATDVVSFPVAGRDFRIVDIPPGYAHSIENVGDTEMIVLFWADEPFDPAAPDTYPSEVVSEKT